MKIKDYKHLTKSESLMKKYHLVYCRKSSEAEDRQMQSVKDQKKILAELAAERNLTILKSFSEAKSAKAPGRSAFNEMINLIYKRDDIKGILCWSINRLTRNPVDTGKLQWLVQQNNIEEIITPNKTYTEVDSDFIMAIEGAQANRFIRDLRRDTLRGLNSKIERGIAPLLAPVGYKNNTEKKQGEKDISPHPVYFPLMRKIFDLAMTGSYTVEQLRKKAIELGIRNNRGGNFISRTRIHECLKNPFYTGKFLYAGKLYQGIHKPMLSDEEFDLVQDFIDGRSKPRRVRHDFITGLIKCGECGMTITAETHTKTYKNGKKQTFSYYRCTKRGEKKCSQPYIPEKELEEQMNEFLGKIKISTRFVDWAIKQLNLMNDKEDELREAKYKAAENYLKDTMTKLCNLTQLKISPLNENGSLLSDEEFAEQKRILKIEKEKATNRLKKISKRQDDWAELAGKSFNFASRAQERFEKGSIAEKKYLMRVFGSNLLLKDKTLGVEPRGPFKLIAKALTMPEARFEPVEKADILDFNEDSLQQNFAWGG